MLVCNIKKVLEEIGIAIDPDGNLYKTKNMDLNLGMYPDLALLLELIRIEMKGQGKMVMKRKLAKYLTDTIIDQIYQGE